MRSTCAEVDGVALAAVSNAHRENAPLVADTDGRAAWQPGVGGADAPVLVGLTAIGGAAVKPRIVNGGSDWPGRCWHRQQEQQAAE